MDTESRDIIIITLYDIYINYILFIYKCMYVREGRGKRDAIIILPKKFFCFSSILENERDEK